LELPLLAIEVVEQMIDDPMILHRMKQKMKTQGSGIFGTFKSYQVAEIKQIIDKQVLNSAW